MKENIIKVDVVSDVACPWCYVGKRRLEAALEKWQGAPVEVTWHPYQLDPTMREEGYTRDEYLINKFGSVEGMNEMTNRLTEAGKTVGINFDFSENWLAVNTLHLHQILNVARQEGIDIQLKELFLAAYFEKTKHLNDMDVVFDIVKEFGWSREKMDAIIADEALANAVKDEISHFQQRGVSGVPFFVINDKYGISGAQPTEVFLEAFQSVSAEVVSEGETCNPNSGCC